MVHIVELSDEDREASEKGRGFNFQDNAAEKNCHEEFREVSGKEGCSGLFCDFG